VDHPSQVQHLDGCLLDLESALEKYIDVAVLNVDQVQVEELCKMVLEFAKQPEEPAITELTVDVTCGMNHGELKKAVLKENLFEKVMMKMVM
jgi:hypothetical protein